MKSLQCMVLALAMGSISVAQASVAVYDSAASFNTAVTGLQTFDFSGVTFPDATPDSLSGDRTVGGAVFSSPGIPFTIRDGFSSTSYGVDFFSGQSPNELPSQVDVSLTGLLAFGFEYAAYATTPGSAITIALDTGEQFSRNLPLTAGATQFIGFVSTAPVHGVTFTTISNASAPDPYAYSLDIVHFQAASSVPEADAWALMLAGLATVGFARRCGLARRKNI